MPASTGGSEISYTLVFSVGVILSALWLAYQPPFRFSGAHAGGLDLLPAFTAALAAGLFVSRLVFVLTYLNYYSQNPIQSLWLWQGGLSGAGGILGALLGIWIYALWIRLPGIRVADSLAVPALIIAISCWIGCWSEGSVYGFEIHTRLPLLMTRDMFGGFTSRWPATWIGLVSPAATLFFRNRFGFQSWKPGCQAALACSAISLGILLASLVRADPLPIFFQLRIDTIAGALLSITGVSVFLICYLRDHKLR